MKPLDPRLLRYVRATRWFLVATAGLAALSAALMVGQALLIATVVADTVGFGADLADAEPKLWGLLAVTVARSAAAWTTNWLGHRAGAHAVSELRNAVLGRVLALGPAYLSGQRRGELVALTTRGISALGDYFSGYLPQLVQSAVVPLLVGTAILTQDLLSAVIVAVTLPIIPGFMVLIGAQTQARVDRQWTTLGVLSGHFLDVVAGLPTLKIFRRTQAARETITRVGEHYRLATMGVLRVSFLSALVLELLATLSVAMIAVSIGLRLVEGTLDLRTGLTVLILAPEVYLPLRAVGAQFHAAAEGLGAAKRMLDLLETAPPVRGGAAVPDLSGMALRVSDLCVEFGDRIGVYEANFVAPAGRVTVIVGPSGAGKSTVLHAILGLIGPPTARISGDLQLEGPEGTVSIPDLDPIAWRARIGFVPQSPTMLAGTVAENVRLGRPDASDSEVVAALRDAGLAPESLRDGLATLVGEGGSGLSVGQARRVGVARALVRDPDVYLLDEPTAALDLGRESDLAETVQRLAGRGRTIVVVSHRPAVIELADRVVRVSPPPPGARVSGGVPEAGTDPVPSVGELAGTR